MTTVAPLETAIETTLRAFLLDILPTPIEVVQAQINRVPQVTSADFVVFTPGARNRLATNVDSWDLTNPNPAAIAHEQSTRITYQLDVYGPNSGDNAQIITTLFRDPYACDFMAASGVQPLTADDAIQLVFKDGENQYENRWTISAVLQGHPVVSTTQQFADTLAVGLIDVDVVYPP